MYMDTSALLKLYKMEKHSSRVRKYVTSRGKRVTLTALHELEFSNAIYLNQYHGVLTEAEAMKILRWFHEDIEQQRYQRVEIDFAIIFVDALNIVRQYTARIGCRSLDVMHLAAALHCGAKVVVSFDKRQLEVCGQLGLATQTW